MKRLAWLVVGVVLFRFWRIAQRHRAEIADMRMRWLTAQMASGVGKDYQDFSVTDKERLCKFCKCGHLKRTHMYRGFTSDKMPVNQCYWCECGLVYNLPEKQSHYFTVTDSEGHDRGHGDAAFWSKDTQ